MAFVRFVCYKKRLGKIGEDHAVKYLKIQGYKVLDRNVYIGGGEIDIIAEKKNTIIFIEVKTRRSEEYVDILDAISEEKEESLITSCEEYLSQNNLDNPDFRIDLIGIVIKGGALEKLEHIKGII